MIRRLAYRPASGTAETRATYRAARRNGWSDRAIARAIDRHGYAAVKALREGMSYDDWTKRHDA